MSFPIASRPVITGLFVAALAGIATGIYLHDDTEYWTCEEELEVMEELEPDRMFTAILSDRANRWIADHPGQCPSSNEITSFEELAKHNWRSLQLVCNDHRLVALSMDPLVHHWVRHTFEDRHL